MTHTLRTERSSESGNRLSLVFLYANSSSTPPRTTCIGCLVTLDRSNTAGSIRLAGGMRGVAMKWVVSGVGAGVCLLLSACMAAPPEPVASDDSEQVTSALSTCSAIDDADTTCDGVDDDCDGALDEDCDFGPSACPAGSRVIVGSAGCDWLWGTSGRDCLLGYGGNDVLFGLEGNDVLVGGAGDDVLAGWGGNDQLFGDRGDDTLLGDGGADVLDGGDGNDSLFGGDGNDAVHGGACQDLLLASGGNDSLFGDEGVDRIEGGYGDSVDGGGGRDACSGMSCELSGTAARFCLRNSDCPSGLRCARRSHVCVKPSDVPLSDPSCDGYDDDCDGRIDESYVSVVTQCGSGACGGTGMTSCVDGEIVDSCEASGGSGGTGGSDGSCDGVDDDCDGHVDEDFASQPTSCGIGACSAMGASACVNGMLVDNCVPGGANGDDSSCNGVDDDCDGNSDEAFAATATTCGVGACSASGTTSCVAGGVFDSCTVGSPSGDSSCNGVDDDCDGQSDEAFVSTATTCGVGACSASGATSCVSGSVLDSCTPGAAASSDASCDGIDDDCSGQSDEDFTPVATSCEVFGCSATGTLQCTPGGVLHDTCPTAPACVAEVACTDDADNDGDGLTDCDDGDCVGVEACAVQTFNMTIDGRANMWGAGHAVAPGSNGGLLPPGITLELGAGSVVVFTSVTGSVTQSGSASLPPDGAAGPISLPNSSGIAGYSHATRSRSLSAVFLGPSEPVNPAP
ncbi:MAG TPA: calcium-binding protein, partial [Conexibacter sp.]|nr:calcium-binding protein [Conexibacter sp.]